MQGKLTFNPFEMQIKDGRNENDIIFNGGKPSVCYTLKTDDITKGKKPDFTPFKDRTADFAFLGEKLYAENTGSYLTSSDYGDGVLFSLSFKNEDLSEYGINLPFNFMGKKDGGGWENQFLFNSPYFCEELGVAYFYLTKHNGGNIVVAVKGGLAGWKMDYSAEAYGHYFVNLKIFKSLDKAYNSQTAEKPSALKFVVLPVDDFSDCLDKLSEFFGLPILDTIKNGGATGEKIQLVLHGVAHGLEIKNSEKSELISYSEEFELTKEGETEIIPSSEGKRGLGATVYAFSDISDIYKKSMDTVDFDVLGKTDGNLCESQCWISAMLRFLLKYSSELTEKEKKEYERKILKQLSVITETDESKAIPRLTVLKSSHGNYPPYHIFESNRIQEQFFGVTIFLDAYKYFGEEKYLDYAINSMDCLIDNYQSENGGLYRGNSDYTTVCCPMIPLLDLADYLKGKDEKKSEKFFESAKNMAEFVYSRGASFPTENVSSSCFEPEMEEGSISCSALLLLYYCKHAEKKDEYVARAKEFLDLHEPWVISSNVCQMKNSTLRWWETIWEGDADGPCICAGHGWTVWRAEADYIYYELTGNSEYLNKALNGFVTNLSKIDGDGNSFANYNVDMINGGGMAETADEIKFKVKGRFPETKDCGLSRYVWIRLSEII